MCGMHYNDASHRVDDLRHITAHQAAMAGAAEMSTRTLAPRACISSIEFTGEHCGHMGTGGLREHTLEVAACSL